MSATDSPGNDPRDITNLFLNQTFKLYKSNQALIPSSTGTSVSSGFSLSPAQTSYLKNNIAKQLFHIYRTQKNSDVEAELIPRFNTYKDIIPELKVIFGFRNTYRRNNVYSIQYLVIKTANRALQLPRQVFVFVNRDGDTPNPNTFNTVILNRVASSGTHAGTNKFILSLLENMPESSTSMVIKNYRMNDRYIGSLANELFNGIKGFRETRVDTEIRWVDELIGDLDITYALGKEVSAFASGPIINSNLRNISVNIPRKDITKFIDKYEEEEQSNEHESPLHITTIVNDFLRESSTINFDNLSIVKLTTNVVNISIEGKFKIFGDRFSNDSNSLLKDELVWFLLESVYNEQTLQ
ncbi:uncharacterized protein RJT20DRAFT_125057 [Scheffersomyces xylosifermentans]|uniref:uncharacterized protein n=1 Tax=Scheffersomyces xylosifermentans TaxID=1304137 RepID=UPI00315CC253